MYAASNVLERFVIDIVFAFGKSGTSHKHMWLTVRADECDYSRL